MLTREDFEQQYAARAGLSVETLRLMGRIVRPCHCDYDGCEGWQSVSRTFAEEQDRDWPEWNGAEPKDA